MTTTTPPCAPATPPALVLFLQRVRHYGPGLGLSAALAAVGMALGQIGWLQDHGFSALTLAIVVGMLVGNVIDPRVMTRGGAGVSFSKQTLLRLGVVLYGCRLTVQDIGHVGLAGVATDALVLGSTFALACYLGVKWLGMDRKTAMLIGAGSSICGAAAVMAAEPVVRARAEQVTVAVASVVVFGTLAIFVYPVLYQLNQHLSFIPGGAEGFGIYAGSTIHEVAQVVAAARSVGDHAAATAVIAKMVRVMMLAPFLILLSAWLARQEGRAATPLAADGASLNPSAKVAIPWFAFAFVAVVLLNSLHLVPAAALAVTADFDTGLLATAMAALGLSTHAASIRKAGFKPLLLALILFVWLVLGGALINRTMATLLG